MLIFRMASASMVRAAALLCLIGSGPLVKAVERPNVLWITAEDMSPTLGCWGDAYASTPHIDALAKQSVIYTRAFATAPVCSPARSCLITGCYATSLGTQRLRSSFPIPDHVRGFPALMRAVGYYCTNNVKTDYNTSHEPSIVAASWDECSAKAHWRGRRQGQPFFAVFNQMTSHQSRTMVMPYRQFQQEVQSRLSPDEIHDPAHAPIPPYYPDTPLMRQCVARYYDCVSVMDQEVGALLQQLEEDGLTDDTIVFFYSDHGSGMPRHKRTLLDTGLHVPLLIHFPEKYRHLAPAQPGDKVERLVSFVDFPPTMLNLCGIALPGYMQGLAFLGPDSNKPRRYVYGARDRVDEAFDLARSVRDERYLYIRNFMPHLSYHQPSFYPDQGVIRAEITRYAEQHRGELTAAQMHYVAVTRDIEELYDTVADPLNEKNLADSPASVEVLDRMRAALQDWIFSSRDLGFLPEEEMWPRISGTTPFELGKSPKGYPLLRLVRAASRVGMPPDALPQMIHDLQDEEAGVRYWAAISLAALGPRAKSAETTLVHALEDQHAAVRIEAAGALARSGMLDLALPVLTRELDSPSLDAVLHAARTIELLGQPARSAAPAMQWARQRAADEGDLNMFIRFATDAFLASLNH